MYELFIAIQQAALTLRDSCKHTLIISQFLWVRSLSTASLGLLLWSLSKAELGSEAGLRSHLNALLRKDSP